MRWIVLVSVLFLLRCQVDKSPLQATTQNVVVVIMDGARYSETFGDPSMQHIPGMRSLLPQATYSSAFYNDGTTNTCNGHVAITTGFYQNINNGGYELPDYPGYPQIWMREKKRDNTKAWIITSKDKLEVLRNCKIAGWKDLNMPMTDCGNSGLFSGYRVDSLTLDAAIDKMQTFHPNIMVINFREPDVSGHANSWENYLRGIRDVDTYIAGIWQFIQSDPHYRDNTTLFATNDHGRHSPNIFDGFVGHGDACDGCRHIMLFAIGKGISKGKHLTARYGLIDLHATISSMMGISNTYGNGVIMKELFQEQ